MKFSFKLLFALVLIFSNVSFLHAQNKFVLQKENVSGGVIEVTSDTPIFKVKLKSAPSTGFSWTIKDYDKQLLTLKSSTFQPPKIVMVGAPGVMVWEFEVDKTAFNHSKRTNIVFEYARPWTREGATRTVVTVLIH